MRLVKIAGLATVAVATTGGIAFAAASSSAPSEPGRTLPTVAASQAQEHAGPVLASHAAHTPKGHAYGRGHGTGKPAGVPGGGGASEAVGNAVHPRAPFSVPPVHGRPTVTPPVPAPPVSTPAHPTGPPTAIPSHAHPTGAPSVTPSHSHR
jgi:hypothetical protein